MGVVILGDLFQFPEGSAATNRVYTYAKGLQEYNVDIDVVCFGNDYVAETEGVADGIPFYYPFGQKQRNPSFWVRRWQTVRKYVKTYILLKKINKRSPIDAIIGYSNFTRTHVFAFVLAKLFRTKLLNECNEHPLRYFQQTFWKRKQGQLKCFIETAVADGVICISQYLVDFFKQRGVKDERLFLLPSTVDNTRFQKAGGNPLPDPYIGYFGSLTFERDNIDLLIRAFAKISPAHSNVRLVLGGFCSEGERKKIDRLIAELGIAEKVQILQYLSRQEITRYITHAGILVMVRSKDLQSDASYPSKLSEFLATGNPVVAVKVGDVPLYLKDGVNAFLAEPGNVAEVAGKLDFILRNDEEAKQVGQRGFELTKTTFHYNFQVGRMLDYIASLNNEKKMLEKAIV